MKNTENRIIVAFHIGRGGRFHNAGHLSFIGEQKIGDFTEKLFCNYENQNDFSKRLGFDVSYGDTKCILDCINDQDFDTLEEAYGITEEMLGEQVYYAGNGSQVGLTESDVESGIGKIDEDGEYDTTYTVYADECSEREIEAIRASGNYKSQDLKDVIGEIEVDEEETEE